MNKNDFYYPTFPSLAEIYSIISSRIRSISQQQHQNVCNSRGKSSQFCLSRTNWQISCNRIRCIRWWIGLAPTLSRWARGGRFLFSWKRRMVDWRCRRCHRGQIRAKGTILIRSWKIERRHPLSICLSDSSSRLVVEGNLFLPLAYTVIRVFFLFNNLYVIYI